MSAHREERDQDSGSWHGPDGSRHNRVMTTFQRSIAFIASISFFTCASSCGDDDATPDAAGALQWYETCGDPVCSTYMPTPGATLCTTEAVGDPCSPDGATCEIVDDACNKDLMCTTGDPATNCPISQKRFKRDIRYLTAADRARATHELLATRLATYRYRTEPDTAPIRLGFMIEDQPDSPAVLPGGHRVDLYGYTSMAGAALQTPAAQIQALERRLARLTDELAALRASEAHDQTSSSR